MLLNLPIEILIILIPILVFSLCFHEFAHGYIAYRLGDMTASRNGRLTLNPLVHLDPIGSIMLLFVGFGWAKPVPVNPNNFKNPSPDMMKVAIAGPVSNLLLAFIGGLFIRISNLIVIEPFIFQSIYLFVHINIALAIFNLIPIEPLDGSKIFNPLIYKINPELSLKLELYGPKVLLFIILLGIITGFSIIWIIINPFIKFFTFLFAGL